MIRLTAIIITKNEEKNIKACLESVKFADEIIVVDSQSEDKTKAIASQFTEKIYDVNWQGYAQAKNFGIDKAKNDWILSIDADERISDVLKNSILEIITSEPSVHGFMCSRRTSYLGQWIYHGGWYPDLNIRLFNRNFGRFKDVSVHESVEMKGKIGRLDGDILHYSYDNISDHIRRIDHYTGLIAKNWIANGRTITRMHMIVRPVWEFFRKLIFQKAFMDGYPGWVLAGLHSFYVFMKYAKTFEMQINSKSRNHIKDKGDLLD